jgi:hypothetical protein
MLYLVALAAPQIIITPGGPAAVHSSDGSLVTSAKPARAGEILTLFASGLGPTKPGVDPGQPFPSSPLQIVNSPVQVLVNGNSADVGGSFISPLHCQLDPRFFLLRFGDAAGVPEHRSQPGGGDASVLGMSAKG